MEKSPAPSFLTSVVDNSSYLSQLLSMNEVQPNSLEKGYIKSKRVPRKEIRDLNNLSRLPRKLKKTNTLTQLAAVGYNADYEKRR